MGTVNLEDQIYTQAVLEKKTIGDLKPICESLKIKTKGNKSEVISRILKAQSYSQDDRKVFLKKLEKSFSDEKENSHKFYRETFNYIDLNQRVWNQPNYNRKIEEWRYKFLFCTLKQMLINACAIYGSFVKIDLIFVYLSKK